MKIKNTKRALLMSALSLMMCVSMLVGSTFAWFTDSVTSAGNRIQAGTLDVQLLMYDGADYVDISEEPNPIFGTAGLAQDSVNTLWEPGKTQVAYLAVKNNGNLALQYNIGLEVENVSNELYEVIQYAYTQDAEKDEVKSWNAADGKNVVLGAQPITDDYTVMNPGDVHYFALSIHMMEDAGNEYQGGEADFDLIVSATQATVESDSFGTDYDQDATRESNVTVASKDEIKKAFENAKDGDVITLAGDFDLTEALVYNADADITLDLGGHSVEGDLATLIDVQSGNITIQNGAIKNVKDNATETQVSVRLSGNAVAEIKNVAIETTGTGILLTENAKITELNANVNSYVNANGYCAADAISLTDNARIDLISGGEYVATYSDEFINAYSGSFSGMAIYPININSADASIGEISGGTFLGRADDGRNGATIFVNAGKIEKISGGYFGYCKYTLRNYPYFIITVNSANGASIDAITGGTFEYASGFGCSFADIVANSGSKIEVRLEKATVSVKFSSSVKTQDVAIWDVVPQ